MDSPRAYLDTNVLKFSATALSRLVPRQQTINWGGLVQEVTVHDIKLVNPNETITDETLRRETELLPRLAQLGKLQKLRFAMQVEAEFESLGLRNMDSQTGRFYGAPIERVDAPVKYGRVMVGLGLDSKDAQFQFLSSLKNRRFLELQKITGAYQGEGELNRNQLLDAFHFWCAEFNSCAFFLTLDFKLIRMLNSARVKHASPTLAVRPSELMQ